MITESNNYVNVLLQGIAIQAYAGETKEEIVKSSLSGNNYVGGELVLSEPIYLGANLKHSATAE